MINPCQYLRPSHFILIFCQLLLVKAFFLESYRVSSGSMAPTILGPHTTHTCQTCGHSWQVGQNAKQPAKSIDCPSCGQSTVANSRHPGMTFFVNKLAFVFRQPQRWDLAVFRFFGTMVIKRIIGLPGETVELINGDVYINGKLCRKTLAESERVRILVFDSNTPCATMRWQVENGVTRQNGEFHLISKNATASWITYRHIFPGEQKLAPLRNEYVYNSNRRVPLTFAHDFSVECIVECQSSTGQFWLCLSDGSDKVRAEIPWGIPDTRATLSTTDSVRTSAKMEMTGKSYLVKMMFVDRRAVVEVAGKSMLLDLPPLPTGNRVFQPLKIGVVQGEVLVKNVRLFRDVYYTQEGRNGVNGQPVTLGPDRYFVLGDNSPVSRDSRFWPNESVTTDQLIGQPIGFR